MVPRPSTVVTYSFVCRSPLQHDCLLTTSATTSDVKSLMCKRVEGVESWNRSPCLGKGCVCSILSPLGSRCRPQAGIFLERIGISSTELLVRSNHRLWRQSRLVGGHSNMASNVC